MGRVERLLVCLGAVIALGAFIWLDVYQDATAEPGTIRHFDFSIYAEATNGAWLGIDPYEEEQVGLAFLYPPPSLLLIRAVQNWSPTTVPSDDTFEGLSVLAAVTAIALLMACTGNGRPTWMGCFAAAVLLLSAGVLETLRCGQINLIVVLLIAAFLWCWRSDIPWLAAVCLAAAVSLKVTPIVFAGLMLAPGKWRHVFWFLAALAAVELLAESIIPVPGLTRSFMRALRDASGQPAAYEVFNLSLSLTAQRFLHQFGAMSFSWQAVHYTKLAVLCVFGVLGLAAYVHRPRPLQSAVTALLGIAMVAAPNLVWLHHATLLIPSVWLMLVEARSRWIQAGAFVALLAIQSLRYWQRGLGIANATPMAIGQVLLLATAAAWCLQAWWAAGRAAAGGSECASVAPGGDAALA